ncbi:unnamed protein product [Tilletia controversa]|uniref:DUF1772-domain-containing protein n=3 Tax=Tilletia TaxID=13289 RepID=A0A8X7MMA4_9BASI|nr:hypothetical protein CF336_g6464 [Tilletia laevis]KAE8190063.1 hypothetical protein CF328_g6089 [Tilletia controversa]KAE8254544.1 hypothetical protein A4X03_0g5700 [Tilletia caries]KAE8192737.1 hypothetical protein CF335_g5767 [Tilletia laevis]KAE8242094.1 hypothetical protein A4X06_0g7244 [Tilletia controversa]
MSHFLKTPFAVATGLGLASSSYFFFGNLGMVTCGVIKMTTSAKLRHELDINADRAVGLWACMYENGALQFAPTSIVSAVAFLVASHTSSGSARFATVAHQKLASRLLLSASVCSLAIVPFTILVMLPNIKPLIAARDKVKARRSGKEGTVHEGEQADQIIKGIELWKLHNTGRMAIGFVTWVLGMTAALVS